MAQATPKLESSLSKEFAARLERLKPEQTVRAILLLKAGENANVSSRRQSKEERQQAIEGLRAALQDTLIEVDQILSSHNGKRLSESPNALGSVVVETTAEGIRTLADSPHIKTIFEDQPIFQR